MLAPCTWPLRAARRSVLVPLAAVSLLTGCSAGQPDSVAQERPAAPSAITAHGTEALPSDSLQDWVSYAEHVALVRVVDSTETAVDAATQQSGTWTTNARVTLEVEQVLWTERGREALPDRVQYTADGWVHDQGTRTPIREHGAPRVEVGQRYVVALVRQQGHWMPISQRALAPVVGNRIVPAEGQENAAVDELAGRTVEQIREQVRQAPADPAARRHANLPPFERFQAVQRERSQPDR